MNRFQDGFFIRRIDEVPRGTANAKRCEGSERDVLVDECFHRVFSLTLCTVPKLRAIPVLVVVFLGVAQAQTITRLAAPVMVVSESYWVSLSGDKHEERPESISH